MLHDKKIWKDKSDDTCDIEALFERGKRHEIDIWTDSKIVQ